MPDLVRSFRAGNRTSRSSSPGARQGALRRAGRGLADLTVGTRRARSAALRTRLIAIEPLRLAVQRDHPRAGQPIHLADVATEPFVPSGRLRRSATR